MCLPYANNRNSGVIFSVLPWCHTCHISSSGASKLVGLASGPYQSLDTQCLQYPVSISSSLGYVNMVFKGIPWCPSLCQTSNLEYQEHKDTYHNVHSKFLPANFFCKVPRFHFFRLNLPKFPPSSVFLTHYHAFLSREIHQHWYLSVIISNFSESFGLIFNR